METTAPSPSPSSFVAPPESNDRGNTGRLLVHEATFRLGFHHSGIKFIYMSPMSARILDQWGVRLVEKGEASGLGEPQPGWGLGLPCFSGH